MGAPRVARVAALRSALVTRLEVLFEVLALRHQLGVIARSDRRFRPADRVLWLCLERFWPRWREALVLVQPATVVRWRREGFWRCWRRRSRRQPGRPRIDSELQALIRRMSVENFLWGAPRIHGELLKLGITVSERTVSRYLPHRLVAPSQTWRTFLANHVGFFTCSSAVTFSDASSDDAIGADAFPFRWGMPAVDALDAPDCWAGFDAAPTLPGSVPRLKATQSDLYRITCADASSGTDPPEYLGGDDARHDREQSRESLRVETARFRRQTAGVTRSSPCITHRQYAVF